MPIPNVLVYDTSNIIDLDDIHTFLLIGEPVIFTGENSNKLFQVYSPSLIIENQTSTNRLEANGLWLQKMKNETIEHQIQVYDIDISEKVLESVYSWSKEITLTTTPEGYKILGSISQIVHHEPYGLLESRTEVLKLVEDNNAYDWYDVTVTQRLIPGANYTTSSWEWNWLQYTMNGSLGTSNIYLSDYDSPVGEELPGGPFSLLWRLFGFDIRKYIPWFFPVAPKIIGVDMSDFRLELFRTRYEAPRNYMYKKEPLEKRHHYVIRIEEGGSPIFWHQTQVQYSQVDDYAKIPYITPPLASGYVTKKR